MQSVHETDLRRPAKPRSRQGMVRHTSEGPDRHVRLEHNLRAMSGVPEHLTGDVDDPMNEAPPVTSVMRMLQRIYSLCDS